ncbi:unnamed protein product [Boreogadus saida]
MPAPATPSNGLNPKEDPERQPAMVLTGTTSESSAQASLYHAGITPMLNPLSGVEVCDVTRPRRLNSRPLQRLRPSRSKDGADDIVNMASVFLLNPQLVFYADEQLCGPIFSIR